VPEPQDTPRQPTEEEVDGLPVLAATEPRVIDRAAPAPLPVVVAAATGGFIAGVASWVLLRVLRRPRASRPTRLLRRRRERGIEIAGSRSFLVDVHLLKR
jgi:hypothetical protein